MSELWDVYTKDRVKTGRTHERGLPLARGDYHLVVVIWIVDRRGRFILTKRHPLKEVWPEMWECTGGSVIAGEDSAAGALREVQEEIGIGLDLNDGRVIYSCLGEDTIYDYWLFIEDVDVARTRLQEGEVTDIMCATKDELRSMFDSGLMIPTLSRILELMETDAALKAAVN